VVYSTHSTVECIICYIRRRGVRLKFCRHSDPNMAELVEVHELTTTILGTVLGIFSKDFCLKTLLCYDLHCVRLYSLQCGLRFANYIIILYDE